eukprot:9906144-Karenia_brevis.AAC.1
MEAGIIPHEVVGEGAAQDNGQNDHGVTDGASCGRGKSDGGRHRGRGGVGDGRNSWARGDCGGGRGGRSCGRWRRW